MRWTRAPAKINLTLRVVGRRPDGYHDLESLVAFAGLCDWLAFEPGDDLSLDVLGPRANETGPLDKNLVLRAARSLAGRIPRLRLGRFRLIKRLPAAAGLGGGSADAAAALRSLANEAGLPIDDPRVCASARATGADVLACLSPQARTIRGIGDELGPAIRLPDIFAVLVNPRVEAPTPKVFAAFDLTSESNAAASSRASRAAGFDTAGFGLCILGLQRPGNCCDPGSAGHRRCAQEIVPNPRGQSDGNVGFGSNLLCPIQRSAQRGLRKANSRSRPSGMVGRGDRPSLDGAVLWSWSSGAPEPPIPIVDCALVTIDDLLRFASRSSGIRLMAPSEPKAALRQ